MSEHPLFYKDELQKGTFYLLLCGFFAVIAILWRLNANHHDDPFQDRKKEEQTHCVYSSYFCLFSLKSGVSSTTTVGLPGIYN